MIERAPRWFRRAGLAVAAATVAVVAVTPPAAAELEGGCAGRGVFQTGTAAGGPFTADPAALGPAEVLEVPVADTVSWEGSLIGLTGAPRPVAGRVVVDLPWPFGQMVVGDWNSESSALASSGQERYELPALVPRGVVFRVSGEHFERGELYCAGSVLAKVEGGLFDSPVFPVALVLTALSGGLLVWTGVRAGPAAPNSTAAQS